MNLPSGFDPQPTLQSDNLHLRPLTANDHEGRYAAARDPLIWAGHPARTRHQPEVFAPYFDMLLTSGTTLVATDRASGRIIGCSRYYAAPDVPNSVSIGFTFLTRGFWGGPSNLEMKSLMLAHAFKTVDTVWLHIGLDNVRSQKATAKLGAQHAYDANLKMGGKDGMWQCWRIASSDWTSGTATP